MLIRLLLFRMSPIIVLFFCKERRLIKYMSVVFMLVSIAGLLFSAGEIFTQEGLRGMLYLPAAMFPHYIFYGFAIWMLLRCIWSSWSERVWKRIHCLSFMTVLIGVLLENYWNPKILQFFFEIFK